MLCPSCGQQNHQNARFCNACGTRLSQRGQGGNIPNVQSPPPTRNTSPGGQGWQSPNPAPAAQQLQPPNPAPAAQQLQATPKAQIQGKDGIEGYVQDLQHRTEQVVQAVSATGNAVTMQILEFHLEQFDTNGNRVCIVPVEMRARSIVGFIKNGHRVRVFGKIGSGLLHAKRINDLDTHATVHPKGFFGAMKIFGVIALIIFLILATFVVFNIVSLLMRTRNATNPQFPFALSISSQTSFGPYYSVNPLLVGAPPAAAQGRRDAEGLQPSALPLVHPSMKLDRSLSGDNDAT